MLDTSIIALHFNQLIVVEIFYWQVLLFHSSLDFKERVYGNLLLDHSLKFKPESGSAFRQDKRARF